MAIPNFIDKIKSAIDHEFKRNLYKNLVFKGGGVRGIAYMGALEVLDEYRIVENIQRVAGTSAGAIAATIVSFRLSVPESKDLFNTLDFSKVPQSETKSRGRRLLRFPEEENYRRFIKKYGWYSTEYFYHWLEDIIAAQCDGNGRATFTDFQERGFRELYIVAANISRQRAEIFSAVPCLQWGQDGQHSANAFFGAELCLLATHVGAHPARVHDHAGESLIIQFARQSHRPLVEGRLADAVAVMAAAVAGHAAHLRADVDDGLAGAGVEVGQQGPRHPQRAHGVDRKGAHHDLEIHGVQGPVVALEHAGVVNEDVDACFFQPLYQTGHAGLVGDIELLDAHSQLFQFRW